jgi:formylglycine-generating enzyme required for sulfatase activity
MGEKVAMANAAERVRDTMFKAKLFISYSRKDMAFADRLEAALKARGFDVLIDRAEIYAFEDWWRRLQDLIISADTVVFIISPDSVSSNEALKEVEYAASLNKRFAPIVCRRAEGDATPEALRRLNFIFFDDPTQFESNADHLAAALNTDIGWVRQHTEYGEAHRRWLAAGRPRGLLLHSPTLEVAEYWIGSRPSGAPEPTNEIRAFVAISRQGTRSAQRLRRIAQGSIFTLMTAVILGLIGWINQDYIKDQWRAYTVIGPFIRGQVRPYVLSVAAERALSAGQVFTECSADCPQMVVISAGKFVMGSPASEAGHRAAEEPQHIVAIPVAFAVSKFEITFAEWDNCVEHGDCAANVSDSGLGRGNQPVTNVDWDDAKRYVAWLSHITGKTYRLLSEAEWEYAARAGTQTAYYWGDSLGTGNANCTGCGSRWDGKQPAPAGSFAPNTFGLYDMEGNLWQYVEDCFHPNYDGAPQDGSAWLSKDCKSHVVRAGAWLSLPQYIRNANRTRPASTEKGNAVGFRIARTLSP